MRAYLSYNYGVDVTEVLNLLQENNVEIFDSISDSQYGSSFQQTIKIAVKSCDFLVFIYTNDNPYIAFEAGMAVAFNKPIFSILTGSSEDSFLYDSTYVHAQPLEIVKIKFSFELFLKNITSKKSLRAVIAKSSPIRYYGGGEAVPEKHYFDISKRYTSIQDKSGIALELFFQEVFQAYNINIAKNSNFEIEKEKWLPDFSIWSDDLSSLLGNPIIVEIKREISNSNLEELLLNLDKLKNRNPINSVLIFFDHLRGIKNSDLPITPNRLFIAIPDLINELEHTGFASAIKKIRNNIVHYF